MALQIFGGGGVKSVNGNAGVVSIPDVASAYIGQVKGVATQPWKTPLAWDFELWKLSNFRVSAGFNSTTLTPSLTANGTTQNVRTLVDLGNVANQDRTFRLSTTVTSLPANGWAEVTVQPVDSGGTILAGAVKQSLINSALFFGTVNQQVEFDFKIEAPWGVGSAFLEVRLDVYNNASSGTLTLSATSLKETGAVQRPMMYGLGYASNNPSLWVPLFDPRNETWRLVEHRFGADGALTTAITDVFGYNTDRAFRYDTPDPKFLDAYQGVTNGVTSTEVSLTTGQVSRSLHTNNNDQIMQVMKADGTYELRGNTHGGETLRSAAVLEVDARGDGTWAAWDGLVKRLRPARRFRVTLPTKLTRSAPDSNDYANVDHVATYFPDGMIRMDRTTTFTADARIAQMFEWMTSHDITVPHVGRIGSGLIVLDEVDVFPKLATPAAPGVAGSTTGGTLAAATRYYATTVLSSGGETNASPVTSVTNTGTTSSNALTLAAAPTGATARRVYVGASPTTLTLVATLAPGATSWTDDGTAPAVGCAPPAVNLARQLDATTTVQDWATSDQASWAVWFDPITNLCFGNIYDRDSLANRAHTRSVKVKLGRGSGIKKNYINVYFDSDGGTNVEVATRLFPAGTVWTATHWSFCYVPSDPANYHLETAARAASLASLKAVYPNN